MDIIQKMHSLANDFRTMEETVRGFDAREVSMKAREEAVILRELNAGSRERAVKDREEKVAHRESAMDDVRKSLAMARADVADLRKREKFLDEKIEALRQEKGEANAQLSEARAKLKAAMSVGRAVDF